LVSLFGSFESFQTQFVFIQSAEAEVLEGGKVSIRAYDPYAKNKIWTAKDSQGNEYKGAEVTSEGFQAEVFISYYIAVFHVCDGGMIISDVP